MKKIIVAGLLSALLILTVTGCGNNNQNNGTATQPPANETQQNTNQNANQNTAQKPAVSEGNAKATALKHAGLKESDVTFVRQELDHDDGIQVYDLEFDANDREYDYNIDAQTGKVVSFSEDVRYEGKTQKSGTEISTEKAKTIVLDKIKGAADNNVRIHLETDDGWKVYEGEVFHNNVQYEFEIDAVTGEILKWSEDHHDRD